MRKILQTCMLFLFVFAAQAYAQDRSVSGTVTAQEDGLPLPGVSVVVKGTQLGTQTNADGKFTLNVPKGKNTLVLSLIGYANQELSIPSSNSIKAVLEI